MRIFTLLYKLGAQAQDKYDLDSFGIEYTGLEKEEDLVDLNKRQLSIPISSDKIFDNQVSFSRSFYSQGLVNKSGLFEFEDITVVIRLENANKKIGVSIESIPRVSIYLFQAIADFITTSGFAKQGVKFKIILPKAPPQGDFLFDDLLSKVAKYVELIDSSVGSVKYTESLKRIETKIIKRIGHFKRDKKYFKYFYDGAYCTNEIIDILKSFVGKYGSDKNAGRSIIFYDDKYSKKWLKTCIDSVQNHYEGLRFVDINNDEEIAKTSEEGTKVTKCLLLADLINTGTTANQHYQTIRDNFRGVHIEVFTIILCHQTSLNRNADGLYSIQIPTTCEGKNITFLYRANPIIPEDAKNPYLKFYIKPTSHESYEYGYRFSSYVFWTMVGQTGFITEKSVPKYSRSGMTLVPDFEKLMALYGPLVVKKINIALEIKNIAHQKPLFVCPDESGAAVISESIVNILDADVIKIPRKVLQNVSEGKEPFTSYQKKKPWFFNLEAQNDGQHVLLFDDFTVTGGTIRSMEKLFRLFGASQSKTFNPIGSIVLVDYRSTKNTLQSPTQTSVTSLYESSLNYLIPEEL